MAIGAEETPYDIPKSRGVPNVVRWLFMIGIVVIFFMGAIAVIFAGDFHIWPVNAVTTTPLRGQF